ncbi:solute carrier family 35 member F6 [Drosophila guanche]|uniref:Blast:Solute carrier family 35 member F6 n=2 Tax=Drosophila guanche TaxID=7266 RepID=A0A3B0JQP9_DROGU|nr:solute carrier family 35 member F6 [Drosophila guanche]SPP84494.1 blast:Solute carrier family 35 member F6 [Drosophila guanche]
MDHRVFLSLVFVLSGTFNVLVVKWANQQQVIGSDGELHGFQHPVVFTMLMFLGEFLCFIAFKVGRLVVNRRGPGAELDSILTQVSGEFHPLSMLLPTMLDAMASILLFTGLYLTYATSFQMIRGAALIFVGIFSTMYLNNTLGTRHWLAIFTMACGILDIISLDVQRVDYDRFTLPHKDHKSILAGDMLIIIAEILHGLQYVYEEKQLKISNAAPLQATGWQGIFGMAITAILAICMHFVPSVMPFNESSRAVFDDWSDLWTGLEGNAPLILALIGFTLSCAVYNFIGLFIVMYSSSANRLLADGLRVYFIFVFVIVMEWEYFNLITIMGFIIMQMGIIMYRQAIFVDWYRAALARWQRSRYVDLSADAAAAAPNSRPADVI